MPSCFATATVPSVDPSSTQMMSSKQSLGMPWNARPINEAQLYAMRIPTTFGRGGTMAVRGSDTCSRFGYGVYNKSILFNHFSGRFQAILWTRTKRQYQKQETEAGA